MNNFTLIIPTHNRHIYLKRSMEYFKNLVAEVIYCDSSLEKYQGKLYRNIKYLHLPNKRFAEKIIVALTEIKADYVAMCADDDFILIDSLYKGFDFLSNNKNFKTIVGKYLGFNECFEGKFFPIYQELPEDIDFGFDKNWEVFFKNYYQILWSMYDKKVLEKAFQIIKEAKFHNDNFIELTIGTCACYEGGIKFLNEIWGVREISTKEHWGNRHVPILSMKIAEANGDYQRFKELVDFNTFDGCAYGVMNSYLSVHSMNRGSLRSNIGNMIPEVFKKVIKKCVYFHNPKTTITLDQISKKYLSPISKLLNKDFKINN